MFRPPTRPDRLRSTHSLLLNTVFLSQGLRRPGPEFDHWPPAVLVLPLYSLMARSVTVTFPWRTPSTAGLRYSKDVMALHIPPVGNVLPVSDFGFWGTRFDLGRISLITFTHFPESLQFSSLTILDIKAVYIVHFGWSLWMNKSEQCEQSVHQKWSSKM
jgi:hypothetical protein